MIYVVVVISLCNRRRKTNQYRWISLRGIFSQSQKTWRRKIDVEVHIRSYKIKCSKAFASSWSFIHDQSLSCLINIRDLTLNIWISLLSKKRHKLLPDPSPAHLSTSLLICNWILSHMFFYSDSKGDVYEGDWVNDLRQGHGIMKFVDGTIYGVSWHTVHCVIVLKCDQGIRILQIKQSWLLVCWCFLHSNKLRTTLSLFPIALNFKMIKNMKVLLIMTCITWSDTRLGFYPRT